MSAELDRIAGAFDRMSKIAHLRDLVGAADDANKRRCGSCFFWMKSRLCPREHNVNGMTCGPSCDAPPCSKFQMTQAAAGIVRARAFAAIAYAEANGLPIPPLATSPHHEGA